MNTAPPSTLATRLWAVKVELDGLETIDFDAAASWRVAPERLVNDEDYADCQDLAEDVRAQGRRAMIVPSAAPPGTRNVVLFGSYVLAAWSALASAVALPGTLLADAARPPYELVRLVRRRATAHPAYSAWQRQEPYEPREPREFAYPTPGR